MPSNYAKEQMIKMQTQAMFPFLIEVTLPNKELFRYVNADFNVEFENNIYNASFFKIDPPDKNGAKIGNATLTISSIDQFWIEKIRATQDRAKIRFIAVIGYERNNKLIIEPIEDYEFTLANATWNDKAITWSMLFDEVMEVLIPCDKATTSKIPALG